MTGKRIGYVRVSTPEQNPDRQLEGIKLDKRFIEYASGRSLKRPQLLAMLDYVREDDIIFVHSMDRLARSLRDLRNLINDLNSKRINIKFIKENLEFNGLDCSRSTFMLNMIGAAAEFECAFNHERQAEGIAIAKKAGRYKGRPRKITKQNIEHIRSEISVRTKVKKIAKHLNVTQKTIYQYMKQNGIRYEPEPL